MYELMKAYCTLTKRQRIIIDYVIGKKIVYKGYAELSKDIKLDVANVTKDIKKLEKIGILVINRKYTGDTLVKHNPMVSCLMDNDWMTNLLDYAKSQN